MSIADNVGCSPVIRLDAGMIMEDARLRKAKRGEIRCGFVLILKKMAMSSPTARIPAVIQFYSTNDLIRPIKVTIIMSHTKYLKATRMISC